MSRLLKVHVHADCLLLSESHGKRELRVPVEDRRDERAERVVVGQAGEVVEDHGGHLIS